MKPLQPFDVPFAGTHLIEASAGTGKTYNIASLYVRAIIETDKTVDEILVVTFTKAATKELRDRLMKRLRESVRVLKGEGIDEDSFLYALKEEVTDKDRAIEKLNQAIHAFDEAAVFTIHAFCQHALQEWAFASGAPFEAELIGDDSELIAELVDDYWRKTVKMYSDDPLQRPLLKYLMDKGYGPEKLLNQLKDHFGKPYLDVLPKPMDLAKYEEAAGTLTVLFEDLKAMWAKEGDHIISLLGGDQMNGNRYPKKSLPRWGNSMSAWMQDGVAPIDFFKQFAKFGQSIIDESTTKSATEPPPQHSFFKKVDEYIAVAESLHDFDVYYKRILFDDLSSSLLEKKEELQVFSYDDVLVGLENALANSKRGAQLRNNIRKAYPVALVDEFQDTDPVQYRIFKMIYRGHSDAALFMIGDPKQSIYGFRGADIFAYLQAKDDAPSGNRYNLDHNYRSVPTLIDGINALFNYHDKPFILENIPYQPVQPGIKSPQKLTTDSEKETPLEIRQLTVPGEDYPLNIGTANEYAAADTAFQIHRLLERQAKIGARPVEARDIAVLVRSHFQATKIKEALAERSIKSVTQGRKNVFKSEEAAELYTVLKAVAEPASEPLVIAALASSMFGYRANKLFNLQQDEQQWVETIDQFADWHGRWQKHGFSFMFRSLMHQANIAEKVMQLQNGERILTNLIHLGELIQQEEQRGKAGMHSLLKWVVRKINEDSRDNEEEQLRLESDENLVNIVTIHQSKGLEYPIVFCPFLWYVRQDNDHGGPIVYHDPDDRTKTYLDFRGKTDPDRAEKRYLKAREELAEEIRLAYVAITRAQYKCVMNWVPAKQSAHSPLGFLFLPQHQSFKSLEASIFNGQKFDESDPALYQSVIQEIAAHPFIEAPVINVNTIPAGTYTATSTTTALHERSFGRAVPLAGGHQISSFSSLIRGEHDDMDLDYLAYFDEPFEQRREEASGSTSSPSIFEFPKGPNPGTAVHHIFENIDFNKSGEWEEEILKDLQMQDIADRWVPIVKKMLETVISKPLLEEDSALTPAALNPKEMIAELEFYFTTNPVVLKEILSVIRPDTSIPSSLNGFAAEGFMKGFIDLTFRFGGRFYILDYKTNHLGSTVRDYSTEKLQDEMREAMYDVQYHLYLVALHRFLKNKLADYSYEKHMGGAFYLFLRGMNKEGREGIFYDRPDKARIKALDQLLRRGS